MQQLSNTMNYLPLRTSLGTVGVLGIDPGRNRMLLASQAQHNLLQGFANLAALALERSRLAEQAEQAQVLKNTERLQSALLSSISHELRTPLVSITGALSTLAEINPETIRTPEEKAVRQELIDTAYEEARRMNLLVGNLLDMSRLESGALRLVSGTLRLCKTWWELPWIASASSTATAPSSPVSWKTCP